ncbi:MAG: phosphotransferase [candidate division Zixibacteria bacterium]
MDSISEKTFAQHKDKILINAARYFDKNPDELKRLGSFESFVFEFERNSREYILKITHSLHRNENQILGELDWTNYLSEHGISVAQPIQSLNKKWVERIDVDDSYFLIYAFEKVRGHHISEDDWDDSLFIKWGKITGRMHALTKKYKPIKPEFRRIDVFNDGFFNWKNIELEKYKFPRVLKQCHDVIDDMKRLPRDDNSFGLIHTDLHQMNFFIDNGDMTIFDFDDCAYNWFAHDIAIPLFYELQSNRFEPRDATFARRFFANFMEGYSSENQINAIWLKHIPLFMKMREIDCYLVLNSEMALDENNWDRIFMKGRREKIENGVPVVDIDFTIFS